MKTYLKILSVLMLVVIIISGTAPVTAAPLAATTAYAPDYGTVFPNPERGYHNRYEIIDDPSLNPYVGTGIPGFSPDAIDHTFARAKGLGNTIIHSYIHLDNYKETDTLPQALLDNLNSGLAAIRTAGLKIVLRPAYEWAGSPSVPEARILRHIEQLNLVISANADVVLHLEAGYLGPWGEWHTSLYTDPFNQEYASPRYHIVKKILDTTPDTIPVLVRYPIFIKEFLSPPSCAVSGGCNLTQIQKDRIGFHNDCFLSDAADMGTYDNNSWMGWFYMEEKRQWMYDLATSFGTNKMMGGETCDSAGDNDAAGVKVQNYMSLLNTTEINEDYAAVNINIWKAANLAASGNDPAETAFVRLKRKMGYRLRLVDATFPTSASAGGNFAFSANLSNDGYSGIIKPRPIYLVFKNGSNRFNVPLTSVDVRTWLAGAVMLPNQNVTLPSNMPAGTYTLALWLPDYYTNLQSRAEYSIRFANQGTWDAANGYNVLSNSITIGGGCAPNCPTNTPGPSATPTLTSTNTPVATNTPVSSPLMIDSFSDSAKWGASKLNDLNQAVNWAMDSAYYGTNPPGEIVLNSGSAGQYYQENLNRSLSGINLTLRLRDWSDTTTEAYWSVVLNDGSDHSVALSTYANVTGMYQDFNIPLNAFGANLANAKYLRLVHSSSTYAVLLVDRISIDGGAGPTSTPLPPATFTPTWTNTVGPTPTKTNTPIATPTRTNTPTGGTAYEAESGSNTLAGGAVIAACGPCSGGNKVGYVGNNAGTLQFNGVTVNTTGTYALTIYYTNGDTGNRTAFLRINSGTGASSSYPVTGGWASVGSITINVTLNAGSNTLKFYNPTSGNWAPDFDRIVIQ